MIPPPNPHSWQELRALLKIVHPNRCTTDWRVRHINYVNMWDHPTIINEDRPYDDSTYREYRRWYQTVGLYSVYLRGQVTRTIFIFLYEYFKRDILLNVT